MSKKHLLFIAISAIIILPFYIVGSLWISVNWLVINKYSIKTGKSNNEITAVVISDLHDHEFGNNNSELTKKISQIHPDLILMDGDILNRDSSDASIPLSLISSLHEIAPIYYALGNHELDYIKNDHPDLCSNIEEAGATVIDKTYEDIEINGTQIRIGGLYDYAFGLDGENTAQKAPADILSFLKDFQNTDRLKIMLSHRPDSFIFGDASKTWNIDLVISGHNHGGQVVLPFLGGLYGGDQGWFPTYIHGIYKKDNLNLFVTSGLGSNKQRLPRFNNPPEIAVLKIK